VHFECGVLSMSFCSAALRMGGIFLAMLLALPVWGATVFTDGAQGLVRWQAQTLLSHPQARDVDVPADVAYQRPMRFKAVPLAVVLQGMGLTDADTLEVVALDGFVAQLPASLVLAKSPNAPQPWLAVEPPGKPWPPLPGKTASAGPFYVVWLTPAAARTKVTQEQWPYAVARLHRRQAPDLRWPQIAVAASVPADSPLRRGQAVFVQQCMVCHQMNGGGDATLGPELNHPMSPVEYFQPHALRQLIRNPASVRQWPGQAMPGFDTTQLSDSDLDALLAYLAHMATERRVALPAATP